MTKTGILKGIPDAYLVLIKTIYELKGVKTVLSSRDIIWNNALIRYKGSLLLFTNWIKHKIYKVSHVYDSNYRKFMSFEQIKQYIPDRGELLFQYNALKMAMAKVRIDEDGDSQQKPNLNDVEIKNLRVKEYKTYLLEKQLTVPYVQKFWENKFEKPELN